MLYSLSKAFQCHVNSSIKHDLIFWIAFSMVKIPFKRFMKNGNSIYTFRCLFFIEINNIFPKIQRSTTWNMFQQCWLVHEFWLVLSIQLQVTLPTSLKITNMHLGTQISKSFLGARSIRNLTRGFKNLKTPLETILIVSLVILKVQVVAQIMMIKV